MSNVPDNLVYTPEHEYVAPTGDPAKSCGSGSPTTRRASSATSSSSTCPSPGRTLDAHESFGTIEAVKAVSELYSPVAGDDRRRSTARSTAIRRPSTGIPYGDGWMVTLRVADAKTVDGLLLARRRTAPTSESDLRGPGSAV